MSAEAQRYEEVFALFTAARDADPEARARLLTTAAPEVRAEVDALLAVDASTRDGHDEDRVAEAVGAAASDALATDALAAEAALPTRIGDYRILARVAEGGQAVVYRAEQSAPQRVVALKVLRGPGVGPGALRRFAIETEALARLEHPGIAPILDAGALETDAGPVRFFAMPWVEGRPLDAYANETGLDIRQRVALLADVAAAVEHAHRKGVIHRDLKPANILVDASGRPRILDFGVARALGSGHEAATLATTTGQIVGTLQYMSPEQVGADPAAIDTRTDVYALGVLLHLLLTGSTPHGESAHVADATRAILETTPSPIGRADPALRGDLETIVAKALAKDPARRYGSAEALEADLRRHLADEPILARPPTLLYVLGRFARRRTALVATLAALVLALVGGVVVASVFATKANRQAERAARDAEALRRENARGRIVAADAALAALDPRTAARLLADVPADLRGWEHRLLAARLDDANGPPRALLAEPEGRVLAAGERLHDGALAMVVAHGRGAAHVQQWRRVRLDDLHVLDAVDLPHGFGHRVAAAGDAVVWQVSPTHVIARRRGGRIEHWRDLEPARVLGFVDGDRLVLVSGTDGDGRLELRLLDFDVRRIESRWHVPASEVRLAAGCGRGPWALATADGAILACSGVPGAGLVRGDPHGTAIVDLAITPDGAHVVSVGADGTIARTAVTDGASAQVGALAHPAPGVLSVAPRGERLAFFAADGTLRVFAPATSHAPLILLGHGARAPTLRPVWSADGDRLATLERPAHVRTWTANGAHTGPRIDAHDGAVLALAVHPAGRRLASVGTDGTVALWDLDAPALLGRVRVGRPAGLAWSEDGTRLLVDTLVGPTARRRHALDAVSGALLGTTDAPPPPASTAGDAVAAVTLPGGTRRAVASLTGGLALHEVATGERLLQLARATQRTTALALASRDGAAGELLVGDEAGRVHVLAPWPARTIPAHPAGADPAWGAGVSIASAGPVASTLAREQVVLLATGREPRYVRSLAPATGPLHLGLRWGRGVAITIAGAPMQPIDIQPVEGRWTLEPSAADGQPAAWRLAPREPAAPGGPGEGDRATILGVLWCPLPAEPIGIGARWRVTRTVRTSAALERTEGVFTLVDTTRHGGRIEATYERASPELLRRLPGLPATIRASATRARERTEATFVLDERLPLPQHVQATRRAIVEVEIEARGEKPTLGFESRMTFTLDLSRP